MYLTRIETEITKGMTSIELDSTKDMNRTELEFTKSSSIKLKSTNNTTSIEL